jgi:hypothetical protein
MGEELLDPETSNEDLLEAYRQVETDGGYSSGGCSGNIASECVRGSLNQVSDALEGREDCVLIGGIPTQIEYVRREGHESPQVMDKFGRRTTNDLDILTMNPSQVKHQIIDSGYDGDSLLKIDTVGPGLIDNAEEIVESGELHSYSAYENFEAPLEADLRVPQDTDLLFTKVHDQPSRESNGTSTDAEIIATSGVFDIDGIRMDELTAGNSEARRYLEQLGY